MIAPVRTPRWVYKAMEDGEINCDQFDVLVYAHYKVDWATRIVSSYSAENVCRFRGLDATEANRKRFRRAKLDLENRGVVSSDYRHGDKRPYHLELPPSDTETIESLYVKPLVRDPVRDSVREDSSINAAPSEGYDERDTVRVRDGVCDKAALLSVTNQAAEKETPLNPPWGTSPLPSPSGKHSNAVGLKVKPATGKSLSPTNCEALEQSVLYFCAAVREVCDFSPNTDHVRDLLRKYDPTEVWFALLATHFEFNRPKKNDLAYFFRQAALQIIDLRRLRHVSMVLPDTRSYRSLNGYTDKPEAFTANLNIKKSEDLWNQIFPAAREPELAAAAESEKP